MSDLAQIRVFLAVVRRRLRLRQALGDAALALAVGGGAALGLVLVAAGLGPSPVWTALAAILAALGAAFGFLGLVRALRRWRGDDPVAALVGEHAGLGDLLVSAVELGRELPSLDAPEAGISPALVRAHLAQAAARVKALEATRIVPYSSVKPRLMGAAVVALAWAATLLLLPERFGRGWQTLQSSPLLPLPQSAPAPLVADIELRLVFPPYTKLPERTVSGTSGEVTAPRGTQVFVTARPLVPVAGADLLVETEGKAKQVAVAGKTVVAPDGRLAASFTVAERGGWRFLLHPPHGFSKREPEAHRIDLQADRAPTVTVRAAADDLEVQSPRAKVEVAWSVEDDYGATSVELVWRGVDGGGRTKRIPVKTLDGVRTASDKTVFDLRDVDFPASGKLEYRIEAKDNDPYGPNVGVSRWLRLHLFSARDKHEQVLAEEQRLAGMAVETLGDRVESDVGDAGDRGPEPPSGDGLPARRETAHTHALDFTRAVERLVDLVDKDRLAPRELHHDLDEMHGRLVRLLMPEDDLLQEVHDRGGTPSAAASRALRDGNQHVVAELERDALLLDDIVGRQRLEELAAIAAEMKKTRDHLKELFADYKKSRSVETKKEIEREIRDLAARLEELQSQARKLAAADVPDEYVNREAAGDNDIKSTLDAIQQLLERGDVDGAMAELDRMSRSLDRMSEGLESGIQRYKSDRFTGEEKALAELEGRLADLEHDQRQIADESQAIRKRAQEAEDKAVRDKVEPMLKEARKTAHEIKQRLDGVDNNLLPGPDHDSLDQTRRDADDLEKALGEGDLDRARAELRDLERALGRTSYGLYMEEQRRFGAPSRQPVRQARGTVGEAQAMARKLAEQLDRAVPNPSDNMGADDKQAMQKLAERQRALRERTADARNELERRMQALKQGQKGDGGSPGALVPADDGLRQAGEHMENAEGGFGDQDPRRAQGEAQQAADRLGQLREQIRQQRSPTGGAAPQQEDETVKIPGADEARGPKAFREDLLDAMKRGAPEGYKERVQHFYEELTR